MIPAQYTILVVDDDPDARAILNRFLTKAGYGVHLAANGREALEFVDAHPPDVIVLDLMMPVMSGFEVLSALRMREVWARLPVVVITADPGHTASHLGVAAVLSKPFNIIDVQAAIRVAISTARGDSKGGELPVS
jgi:CheY-like chemotaxis protein